MTYRDIVERPLDSRAAVSEILLFSLRKGLCLKLPSLLLVWLCVDLRCTPFVSECRLVVLCCRVCEDFRSIGSPKMDSGLLVDLPASLWAVFRSLVDLVFSDLV